jgi:hypothetical protein
MTLKIYIGNASESMGSPIDTWLIPIPQQFGKRDGIDRWTEEITLGDIAVFRAQKREMLMGFHALGSHFDTQRVRHGDDGLDEARSYGVRKDGAHKGTFDLQKVYREVFEIRERGIAGAKIIERQEYPDAFEFL